MRLWFPFARLVALLLMLLPGIAPAQPAEAPAAPAPGLPTVSVLTFTPGEIYWERFGHNGLLLRDAQGQGVLFNYGVFNFAQENFFLNFARGRMLYQLAPQRLDDALEQYAQEGRGVYEQRLALSDGQRQALVEFLRWNLRPENIEYRYDYFRSNCSTRVRDALDRALGGLLQAQLSAGPHGPATYRSEVTRLMAPAPLLAIGMDLGLGPAVDEPLDRWAQAFVPMSLMESLRAVRVADPESGLSIPLVSAEGWIFKSSLPPEPERPPALLLPFLGTGLALGLALLVLGRRRSGIARALVAGVALLFYAAAGVLGLVMLAGWSLTEHWGMWSNQNLLLLNPFALLLLPVWAQAFHADWAPGPLAYRLARIVALLAAGASVLKLLAFAVPAIPPQWNAAWIALLLPAHLALFSILRARRRR